MGRIFFSSDLHFGHDRPFLYEPRGFKTIYEHDQEIIKNWNKTVNIDDDIYVLGDLILGNNDYGMSCLKQLKGRIHIVFGNHDTQNRQELYASAWNVVEICGYATMFKYGKYHFYLSHYPAIVSNYDAHKPLKARTISLCGHCHTKNKFQDFDKGLIFHVELDAHRNTPIEIEEIIKDIKEKIKDVE